MCACALASVWFSCRVRTVTDCMFSSQLWALLHFIMPTLFDSHEEFNEWFSKDIESHAENKSAIDESEYDKGCNFFPSSFHLKTHNTIFFKLMWKLNNLRADSVLLFLLTLHALCFSDQLSRLHMILKPFMLRRIKKDVENELSDKVEKLSVSTIKQMDKRWNFFFSPE